MKFGTFVLYMCRMLAIVTPLTIISKVELKLGKKCTLSFFCFEYIILNQTHFFSFNNPGANSLPLSAHNTIKATVEDEVLNDGDETTPLMGSDLKASDYYNLSSLIPVTGFADYVHGRQAANVDWYKDDFAVSFWALDDVFQKAC